MDLQAKTKWMPHFDAPEANLVRLLWILGPHNCCSKIYILIMSSISLLLQFSKHRLKEIIALSVMDYKCNVLYLVIDAI